MKRVTNLLLLMLFLTSTALFSQNASPGSVKTPEQEAQKLAKMLQTKEMAPNTVISPRLTFTDANFDLQFEYPTGNSTGEAGVETDGNFIYTTLWNGTQFCKYGTDGTFIGLFSVPGASAIRDLAYDGTYFYGAAANTTVFKMDFNTNTLIGTITAPTACRAIAYDEDEAGFYGNNWSTPIVLFDMTGATLATIPTAGDESYYGFAYQTEGMYLWGHSQKTGTSRNMLYKLNLPAGTVAESFDMLTILTLPTPGTDIAGGLYMHPDLVQGTWTLGGIVQNICIWGIEMGLTGPPPTVDVGVTAFVSPVSGPDLGNETVKITVKNFGANSVSNVPVSYTLDGGAAVTGTLAGPIASGATADFTFPGTVNLGTPGQTYVFVGCTALAGDLNAGNNCKTQNVTNVIPTYCDASTTTEDEYIANVTMGLINNSSGWQGGVADYTAIFTEIEEGASQDVVITNGTPWASDITYIWVDWNKNFTFEGGDELTMLTNVGGTGASFTGAVVCPVGTLGGDYRMRIRMTYSTAPTPCGNASYGEIEDYTITVGGGTPTPAIQVSPMVLTQALDPDQTATQVVTVTNTGTAPLTFDLAVNTAMRAYHQNTAEDFARLNARMAADGLGNGLVAIAHSKAGGASTNVSDDETIRYDDGVNFDAIGLTSGGTFQVAAYWPAATMGQYAGMQLQKVEMYINTVPSPCKIKIYGPGTSTTPGALLYEQIVVPAGLTWNLFDLSTPVTLTGQDIWIAYEVTHPAGEYPAGCDAGPAIAGYGDMISLDGVAWATLSGYGLDYNWNLVGYLGGGTTYANDLGVMTILSPVSGVGLGNEVVTITVKNYGTASQSNIPVSYTIDGGAAVNGTIAGPLAANATVDYTFAGTVNMSNVGQTWVFNACTNLAGDQNAVNNCKVANVTNIIPTYCDASTTTEDEYIANVTMGTINNHRGRRFTGCCCYQWNTLGKRYRLHLG